LDRLCKFLVKTPRNNLSDGHSGMNDAGLALADLATGKGRIGQVRRRFMPHHDDDVSLRQMLDHAREASDLVKERVRADLDRDRAHGSVT
jgi:hypothetical protein